MSRYTIKVEEDFYITKYNKKPFPSIYHGERGNERNSGNRGNDYRKNRMQFY